MNILYLHGYGSSGQSSTMKFLKKALPNDHITAPDIPVDPAEALPFLRKLCDDEHFDIIIGTSMGAQYAQQLHNCLYRICVNPAFHISQQPEILKVGTFDFFQPRKDGQTQFTITEEIIQHFREMEEHQFDNWKAGAPENLLCIGLFGTEDTTVNCREEFARYYPNVQIFEGEHRMNKEVLQNVILPIVQRLDIYRRKVGFIGQMENCSRCGEDFEECMWWQSYGYVCGDQPRQFMKRYFAEAEWRRLLKEGLVAQPEEAEPAVKVGDEVYGLSLDRMKDYKGTITKVNHYTDKNHYEAEIEMSPLRGLPIEADIIMDGLFDTPRVKTSALIDQYFGEGVPEIMKRSISMADMPTEAPIDTHVYLSRQEAQEAAEEYLKKRQETIRFRLRNLASLRTSVWIWK